MKLTRGVIAAVLVAGCCWATPAHADTAHDKAVVAFQEGRKYIEAGNCDAAITKLRESLSFEPSVGARLSLADCYEPNDPLAAWRMLKDAANLAYINADDRLPLAETRAAALEKRLATIRVDVPPATLEQPGFELSVDGELLDKFHYRNGIIATKPGKHVVEASAPLRHFAQQVTTETGGVSQVTVQLERDACANAPSGAPAAAAPPVTTVIAESPGSTRRTLGLAIAGAGVAGLASGVVFGILTLQKKSKIADLCGGSAGDCKAAPGSVDPEREAATTTATIATASFIAGGAAVLGGGLLYFTAPSGLSSPARAARGTVRIAPRVGIGNAGMGLEGTW